MIAAAAGVDPHSRCVLYHAFATNHPTLHRHALPSFPRVESSSSDGAPQQQQTQSAAYRFAKQYDCMDVPDVYDPNPSASRSGGSSRGRGHARSDSAAGSAFGDASTNGGSSSRDMVASVGDVKPSIRQFDGKSES